MWHCSDHHEIIFKHYLINERCLQRLLINIKIEVVLLLFCKFELIFACINYLMQSMISDLMNFKIIYSIILFQQLWYWFSDSMKQLLTMIKLILKI